MCAGNLRSEQEHVDQVERRLARLKEQQAALELQLATTSLRPLPLPPVSAGDALDDRLLATRWDELPADLRKVRSAPGPSHTLRLYFKSYSGS